MEPFDLELFRARRTALMARLGEGVALFFAAPEFIRNNDVHFPYRQESDLFYFSGFEEPEVALVVNPKLPPGEQTTVFLRVKDPEKEVWDGFRLGIDAAPAALGVDRAFPIGELGAKLPELMKGAETVYCRLGRPGHPDALVVDAMHRARRFRRDGHESPNNLVDPEDLIHDLRLRKDPTSLGAMRHAAALTGVGHRRAMAITRPGLFEYQLQAAMEYEWSVRGARRSAYPSIVGSGPKACVLHYRENERRMEAGDLVLVDAGCEYGYHASDVTRTWPVSGRFTPAQRAVYEAVLEAQLAAIDLCRPGVGFDDIHRATVDLLTARMVDLGLLEGPAADRVTDGAYKRYYMHRTSHWLGMDVHDVGRYHRGGVARALEAGMVLTVEPGLYIAPDDEKAPPELRGIGVRIEDDVRITDGAPEVLTDDIPKTVAALEALVGSAHLEVG